MFEHVGLRNLPGTSPPLRQCYDRGPFRNHGITATDVDNRPVGSGDGDFIGRHVFPLGMPHLHGRAGDVGGGFEIADVERSLHYAQTLTHWYRRPEARYAEAASGCAANAAHLARLSRRCAYGSERLSGTMLGSLVLSPGPTGLR
jgi:cyclopropane-fatty-acyl-phospholipid synthase